MLRARDPHSQAATRGRHEACDRPGFDWISGKIGLDIGPNNMLKYLARPRGGPEAAGQWRLPVHFVRNGGTCHHDRERDTPVFGLPQGVDSPEFPKIPHFGRGGGNQIPHCGENVPGCLRMSHVRRGGGNQMSHRGTSVGLLLRIEVRTRLLSTRDCPDLRRRWAGRTLSSIRKFAAGPFSARPRWPFAGPRRWRGRSGSRAC
jgi:hypothetical protein